VYNFVIAYSIFILYRTLYFSVNPMHEDNQLYVLVMFSSDDACASDNSWL